ncbi:MAG: hypothetical protein FJ102_01295 [Deltaproteobacteria bacterium]|nr:hypothetical protein [Deltaproteobacteria bacterium]
MPGHPLGDEYQAYPVYIAGTERRFVDIDDGIWGAEEGDRVVVKAGTYEGTVDFHGKIITLCSESGPWATVLDALGEGPVVRLRSWEPQETTLEGFTITGGVGEGDGDGNTPPHGGGVFVEWGSPTIRHNVVVYNASQIGAGIYARNGAPTVENNIVAWNTASQGGGGIVCTACRGRIAFNTIYENDAASGPGGEYFWGAADYVGNIVVTPDASAGMMRWLDPRTDVAWTGGPNLAWPSTDWLVDTDDTEWPDIDEFVFANPGLDPASGDAPGDWQLPGDSPAVDAGPADELDPDGSRSDFGAFGGPEGGW